VSRSTGTDIRGWYLRSPSGPEAFPVVVIPRVFFIRLEEGDDFAVFDDDYRLLKLVPIDRRLIHRSDAALVSGLVVVGTFDYVCGALPVLMRIKVRRKELVPVVRAALDAR
jgi:hypothetical protein